MLSQQKRHFVCLKVGHVLKDCPSSQKKACSHCGKKGYHNSCLCPQKFSRQETNTYLVTEPGLSSEKNTIPTSSADESNQPMTTVNSNATPMFLASGKEYCYKKQLFQYKVWMDQSPYHYTLSIIP